MDETFVQSVAGSYKDAMKEIVISYDSYSEFFKTTLPLSIKSLIEYDYKIDIVSFLISEGEEILANKLLKSGIEISNMIRGKYIRLRELMTVDNTVDTYNFNKFVFDYVLGEYAKIRKCKKVKLYGNPETKYDYCFLDYFETEFKKTKLLLDSYGSNIQLERDDIIKLLDKWYYATMDLLKLLRDDMDAGTICYKSSVIFRRMIYIMVLSYGVISSISTE